jgi:hypothetical protein
VSAKQPGYWLGDPPLELDRFPLRVLWIRPNHDSGGREFMARDLSRDANGTTGVSDVISKTFTMNGSLSAPTGVPKEVVEFKVLLGATKVKLPGLGIAP